MTENRTKRTWVYAGCILLQSIVYGIGNPLTKLAYESITPFWLLGFRFTLAFLLFAVLFGKRIFVQLKAAKPSEILPASACMALAYILCNLALGMTKATNVGFLMSLSVVIAPVLSVFVLKRKYSVRHLPVQLIVLLGVLLLCADSGISVNKGDAIGLIMAFFFAASLVYGEKSLRNLDAIAVSAAQSGMTAVISLLCALLFDNVGVIQSIQPSAWIVVVYLAVFCTCLAYFLQNEALAYLDAPSVSMLQCTQPILTAIAAFFMLGEAMSGKGFLGAVIIMICIIAENLIQRSERKELDKE